MGWIVGLICLVIVLVFWRFFLPLALVLGVAGWLLYERIQESEERERQAKAAEAAAIRKTIQEARANASPDGKSWEVWFAPDPASGEEIARSASVSSNDGLCRLIVEKRIDGSELTGLDCPKLKIREYSDIDVKFDNFDTSNTMDIKSYTNSDSVYIPAYQTGAHLKYDVFLERLQTSKAVAIRVPAQDNFWISFVLNGSTESISLLGQRKPESNGEE